MGLASNVPQESSLFLLQLTSIQNSNIYAHAILQQMRGQLPAPEELINVVTIPNEVILIHSGKRNSHS